MENIKVKKIKYAMLYIVDNCIDCKACMVGCKAEWRDSGDHFKAHIDPEEVDFGNNSFRTYYLASQCNHCVNAPCVTVCPTKASYYTEKGTVDIDHDRCIGCKYCIVSCPYNARYFDSEKGIADKCNLCIARVEAGLRPICVDTCLTHARIFGDMNDPKSEISLVFERALKKKSKIWRLRSNLGTEPSIYYIQHG